jgi:type II secretory pathway pseudopilin PulG
MLELMVAVAMIGLITALSVPSMRATIKNSRTKVAASDVAGLLNFARSKAMQTGNPHLVYFTNDRNGQLMQADGAGVLQNISMLVATDADEDCLPDAGAPVWSLLAFDTGINFQKDPAIVQLPTDTGEAGDVITQGLGVSFTDPGGADTTWISFGFDGIPRGFFYSDSQ